MKAQALIEDGKAIAICPEQLGGLPTPRESCEILDGDGHDVLEGRARVLTRSGIDVSSHLIEGARLSLEIAKANRCGTALLKARSPSCGKGFIYDGTFSGELKPGDGVTAALLEREGITVSTEEEVESV